MLVATSRTLRYTAGFERARLEHETKVRVRALSWRSGGRDRREPHAMARAGPPEAVGARRCRQAHPSVGAARRSGGAHRRYPLCAAGSPGLWRASRRPGKRAQRPRRGPAGRSPGSRVPWPPSSRRDRPTSWIPRPRVNPSAPHGGRLLPRACLLPVAASARCSNQAGGRCAGRPCCSRAWRTARCFSSSASRTACARPVDPARDCARLSRRAARLLLGTLPNAAVLVEALVWAQPRVRRRDAGLWLVETARELREAVLRRRSGA